MARRLLDLVCAVVALVLTAPLLAIAAIGIRLSSPGPVLFRTRRVGLRGRQFIMYKLRTMHLDHGGVRSRITGAVDPRIFPFGLILRRAKIDELPQMINVLVGDMSVVGPRPEVPGVVARHYTTLHRETLNVRPGLTSPGALYHYTIGEKALTGPDTEAAYFERVLPTKLALDIVYVRRAGLVYDLAIMCRTLGTIADMLTGRASFPEPREMADARPLIMPARNTRLFTPSSAAEAPAARAPSRTATAAIAMALGMVLMTGCSLESDAPLTVPLEQEGSDMRYPEGLNPVPPIVFLTDGDDGASTAVGVGSESSRGFYSYEVGSWHVIALNSSVDMGVSSPQLEWLQDDLAANRNRCTVAYWHHPRFASSRDHGDTARTQAAWNALYDAGVEIVLNGRDQHYERFAPQAPDGSADWEYGIRQFTVGTGGESNESFGITVPNSERRRSGTPGALALTLREGGYDWRFIPVGDEGFVDMGGGSCHAAPPWAPRPMRRRQPVDLAVSHTGRISQP